MYKIFDDSLCFRAITRNSAFWLKIITISNFMQQFGSKIKLLPHQIWPKSKKIVECWSSLSKSKQPWKGKEIVYGSYVELLQSLRDPLLPLRDVSKKSNRFFWRFQRNSPMFPFLIDTLEQKANLKIDLTPKIQCFRWKY